MHTLHGSARTSNTALMAELEALRKELAALKVAPVAPATAEAREDLRRTGHSMGDSRKAALAARQPKRYCPRHEHGFAFDKAVCPRDGLPIPQ